MIEKPIFYSYELIRKISQDLLIKYGEESTIPVDIEKIVEVDLGIQIVPVAMNINSLEIEGATSKDMSTIYVNKYCLEHRHTRYRFSLAHELGHIVLHRNNIERFDFPSLKAWKIKYLSGDEIVYSWFEAQANNFAGLILVPSCHLKREYEKFVSKRLAQIKTALKGKLTRAQVSNYLIDLFSDEVAPTFNVSREVIQIRVGKDKLDGMIRVN